ncbi:S1/P1 nuclease [Bradyrhizobium sp. BWC-3-1]|uniref:S1/P1 nuclease n=1 Tax=Bradyrhizobium sp. BWC-3-1 TaxID=3080012 RepID=UPI00293E4E2A|nr:S1/P1 nuclease [Bradyrhizobium sp. BWC-3-1]WOH57713.1 S1/P1 nuclease [Bradyrhizobium sp. BWC-3-1]
MLLSQIGPMTTNFTLEGKNTYRWHFVDIDVERSTYDAAIDCKDVNNHGSCIVEGLPAAIAILKDKSSSKDDKMRALKLVVHLAGDLEQPLHASERNGDQGGNKLHVVLHAKRSDGTPYTQASTFHGMWEDSLVDLQAYSWGSYADALDANPLPGVEAPPYDEARIAGWANDTHTLGIKAYQLLPAGTPVQNDAGHPVDISNEYASAIKADLDSELAKGGRASKPFSMMRLALNCQLFSQHCRPGRHFSSARQRCNRRCHASSPAADCIALAFAHCHKTTHFAVSKIVEQTLT